MSIRAAMSRILLALAIAALPIAARAQSVGDAISNALFENVIYAQAKLKISTPLVRLNRMAVATGGDHLALLAEEGTVRVWNLLRGSQGRPIAAGRDVAFAPSADGTLLMLGDRSGKIELRDARTGTELGSLAGTSGAVTELATSADSLLLVAGYKNGAVEIWDIAARKQLAKGKAGDAAITAMAIGAQAIVGSQDGGLVALDLASGAARPLAKAGAPVVDIRIDADGQQAAFVSSKGDVAFISLAGGKAKEPVALGAKGPLALSQSLHTAAF